MRRAGMTIAGRLLNACFVIAVLSVAVFGFMRAVPCDPVQVMLGAEGGTAEQVQALRHELGLDRPLYVQYLSWAGHMLQGDFGRSLQQQRPVLPLLMTRLKATAELAFVAILLGSCAGIAIGTLSAVKQGSLIDSASMVVCLAGISIPVFWSGILLIIGFSVYFNLFPTGGMLTYDTTTRLVTGFPMLDTVLTGNWTAFKDIAAHFVLPAVTLALPSAAMVARTTRAAVLEIINEDYVNAGLARGLSFIGVLWRHVMRNAMIPVVTVIGLEIGVYLGGSIVTETLFSWPGLGRFMIDAIYANDYPVVQGAVVVYAVLIVGVNLVVDLTYALIDPRVRA